MHWPSSGPAVAVLLPESDASPLLWSVLYRSQHRALHPSVLLLHSYWLLSTHQMTACTTRQLSWHKAKGAILLCERRQGAQFPFRGHLASRWIYHEVHNTWSVWRSGHLPSHTVMPLPLAQKGQALPMLWTAGGWVDPSGWLHTKTIYLQTFTHLSTNRAWRRSDQNHYH